MRPIGTTDGTGVSVRFRHTNSTPTCTSAHTRDIPTVTRDELIRNIAEFRHILDGAS